MANWCYCELTVAGGTEELIRFRDGIQWSVEEACPRILASYYPIPADIIQQDRGGGSLAGDNASGGAENSALLRPCGENTVEWCRTHWGSKWGDCHAELVEDLQASDAEGTLVYSFDAAWYCPCRGFCEVSRRFPHLTFALTYQEDQVSFEGSYVCRAGDVLAEDVWERCEPDEEA